MHEKIYIYVYVKQKLIILFNNYFLQPIQSNVMRQCILYTYVGSIFQNWNMRMCMYANILL